MIGSNWFLLALSSTLIVGSSMVISKKGMLSVSPMWNTVLSNIFRLIIWVPCMLALSGGNIGIPDPVTLGINLIIALCFNWLYYALSLADVSLMAPLIGASPLVTTVLAVLFIGERLSPFQWMGVIAILLGGYLLTKTPGKGFRFGKWLAIGLGIVFLIGLGDFLTKISVNRVGIYTHLVWLAIIMQPLSFVAYFFDKKGRVLPKFDGNWKYAIIGTFLQWIGSMVYFLSFSTGPASLVSAIGSMFSAVAVILAFVFLKERVSVYKIACIAIIIIGVLFINTI